MYPLKMVKPDKHPCGDCTVCCTVFQIEELNKPDYTDCHHLIKNHPEGHNCRIYDTRPSGCKAFDCAWRMGVAFRGEEQYRPDKLGLVFVVMDTPPMNGILGVFKVHDDGKPMPPRMRKLLWNLKKHSMYFYDQVLYGPQRQIDEWKAKWKIKEKTNAV